MSPRPLPTLLIDLLSAFDEDALLPCFTVVPAAAVPPPYDRLLVHEDHMTIAHEAYHRSPVQVRAVRVEESETHYARRSLLSLPATGRVVQHCTMRIDLRVCSEAVRREILEAKTPLGAILIQHDVMRRIEPLAYLKVERAAPIMEVFGVGAEKVAYGRVAAIHTGGTPTVELLEIVAPE